MDFPRVVQAVATACEQHQVRYALIGGLALNALGRVRSTMDVDLLVHRDDLGKLHRILTELGYERYFESENGSQYRSKDFALGFIDVIHAFREWSVGMLSRAIQRPVFEGRPPAKVLQPEDVIGLKVQAMANDPKRRAQDQADIEELVILHHRKQLDWERIQQYYEIFGMGGEAKQLRARHEAH